MDKNVTQPSGAQRAPAASVAAVTAGSPAGAGPSSRWLDTPLTSLLHMDWETAAWLTLFIVAAVARFYDLGARAMSHDESLHALYSYYLYDAGNYEHNPMMHGPLLFHLNTLVYFLFGASDATARFAPALAGLGVLWVTRLFRLYIGRIGALAAGLMVALSPSLLFHSRYIRNDIYVALFTMIWIYGVFRYLDAAPYMANHRRSRWLYTLVIAMALGFITKENNFISGAIIGAFIAGLALWHIIGSRTFIAVSPALLAGGLAFFLYEMGLLAWALPVGVGGLLCTIGLTIYWLGGGGWASLRRSREADLSVVMVTLVLPFTAPFGHLIAGWDAMAYATTQDLARSAGLVAVMTLISVGIAYFWFGMRPGKDQPDAEQYVTFAEWAKVMGIFWLIQVLFFTTFLTNTRNGLATGIVGSLGYWIAQQEVARGGQPWYYYIMLGCLYEFLPMLLTAGGIVTALYWVTRSPRWDPVSSIDLPDASEWSDTPDSDTGAESPYMALHRETRIYFVNFAMWWVVGSWLAYMVAGEKMPWLMTHLTLPMCIMGGWWFGWLVHQINWKVAKESNAIWLIGVTPALLFSLSILIARVPSLGRSVSTIAATTQWLLALFIGIGLLGIIVRWSRAIGWRSAARLLAIGVIALLLLATVRFSFMLNYINFDYVTEYLVYAHASPDIKRALQEIDSISERTVGERNIVVAYDDDSSWPLSWYMRDYPNSKFYGENPTSEVMTSPVIIVGPNYEKVRPYVARDYVKRTYRLVWWPDQGYFGLTLDQLIKNLTDREKMKRIFDIVVYRRYADDQDPTKERDLTQWPNRHDFEMYVRRDLAAQIWDLGVVPMENAESGLSTISKDIEVNVPALLVYEGIYDGAPLLRPRDVTVSTDGSRVIADTGNHRIVILDTDGNFIRSIGSACRLGEGAAGGCIDTDGQGPLELGDGQFFEPWGVATDDDGNIYVADTWNGRIQIFGQDGNFLRKWGYFNSTNGELGDPYAMFGPRGIAIDSTGNLLVADTGNKRILQFSPSGELVNQVGGGGVVLGRFEEPVDIAVDPNSGDIFVADAWNRRIQKLDAVLQPLAEWPVPGWESREIYNKPYLTVAGNGDVYATDPQFYRVLAFDPDGKLKAAIGEYGAELDRFALPNGIAASLEDGNILVADADNNRIVELPSMP